MDVRTAGLSRPDAGRKVAAPADDQADSHGCPARTLCTWSGDNFNGTRHDFPVADYHSKWYSFNNFAGYNPGTVDDNSASDAYLWSRATKLWGCVPAGNWATDLSVSGGSGYFYITYGVTGCPGLPPLPPGGF